MRSLLLTFGNDPDRWTGPDHPDPTSPFGMISITITETMIRHIPSMFIIERTSSKNTNPTMQAVTSSSIASIVTTFGGGKGLIDNFAGIFGDAFDSTITADGQRIGAGKLEIAGVDMVINPDNDAFEVEIPGMKAVYMHMLGHGCHSIVAGAGHADAIIANLKGYLDRGFEIFLSAHYEPETRQDVQTKIDYLEDLKTIAEECATADDFKQRVNEKYVGYSGANYLDMTAGFFFPQ